MNGLVCFGLEISYARETGYFLQDDTHYYHATSTWLDLVVKLLARHNLFSEYQEYLKIFEEMSDSLRSGKPVRI